MTNNYFKDCKTLEQIRDIYVSLSLVFSPEMIGQNTYLDELDTQYHAALNAINGVKDSDGTTYNYDQKIEADLMAKLQSVNSLGLPNTVKISINGCWLWVRGTVKNGKGFYPVNSRHDQALLNCGLTYHSTKGEFYYRDNSKKNGFGFGSTDSDKIAFMYGAR